MAETSCCIAASYEAKAFGVKTGTRISDARVLCPGIAIVESKPAEYIRHHHRVVEAVEPKMTGVVFKIQANMDPNHRDRIAFVRVCSGKFERDMQVYHPQGAKSLRLPRPYKFFAND